MSLTVDARPSWREEARQDRVLRAQLEREQEEARTRARIAEREAVARVKVAEREAAARAKLTAADARRTARAAARAERGRQWARFTAWVSAHVTDLLFVPVIGVPSALAWSAMSAYGESLYPVLGWLLPLFSEGAMWVFETAVALNRRKDARRMEADPPAMPSPVWHLQAGVVVFAVFGAVLNFAHGMSPAVAHHGPLTGVVMALISVAGVTAHHFTKAGPHRPRRTRAVRDDARVGRIIRRRELKARKESVKAADITVGPDGTTRLILPDAGALAPAEADTIRAEIADTAEALRTLVESVRAALRADIAAIAKADTVSARPDTKTAVRTLRDKHPDLSVADIAARLGITDRTVRRHLNSQPEPAPATA
jgi:hypothetical protein